jgi:hypothetical protein
MKSGISVIRYKFYEFFPPFHFIFYRTKKRVLFSGASESDETNKIV